MIKKDKSQHLVLLNTSLLKTHRNVNMLTKLLVWIDTGNIHLEMAASTKKSNRSCVKIVCAPYIFTTMQCAGLDSLVDVTMYYSMEKDTYLPDSKAKLNKNVLFFV